MKIILSTLFLFLGSFSYGQTVIIETFIFPNGKMFAEVHEDDLRFPMIRTGNWELDTLINTDLKNRFTDHEYPELTTDSTLIKWADERVIYLDYEITYIKNGLISLNISAEGCGAYCTNWTAYFTYSTETGKYVTIDEIVNTNSKFKALVNADKDKQYAKQKKELKSLLRDKESGLNEFEYQSILRYYDDCIKEFEINSYALYPDHLEIIENCYIPNVLKSFTPIIELKYPYSEIKEYLKISNY